MKKITILIALIFLKSVVSTIFAQSADNQQTISNKLDSLFTVIKLAKSDTVRANTYNEIYAEYQGSNPDTALYFANLALNLSKKINFRRGMIDSYNNIGIIYYYQGDYKKSLEFLHKSLKLEIDNGNKTGMASSYGNIGLIYIDQGDYAKSLEYMLKALKIFEELGDKSKIGGAYINIGSVYNKLKNYTLSMDYFVKALNLFEELGDKVKMAYSYTNIGNIYAYRSDYKNSLENYFKALKIFEEINDIPRMAHLYTNIGETYYERDSLEQAIEYYLKGLKIREQIGDKYGISASKINIGKAYTKQSNFKSALVNCQEAYDLASEIGSKDLIKRGCECFYESYEKMENFKEAYRYHKLYSDIKDSIFSEESSKQITEMQTKYETEKKQLQFENLEKEHELQLSENKKQRLIIMFVVCSLLLVVIFSIFLFRLFWQKKKANIIIARKNQSLEIAYSEINSQKEEITAQRDEIEAQRDEIFVQHDLVTKQKEHIEEIYKEVSDSINYAKRIQEAMLPDLSFKFQTPNSKSQEEESQQYSVNSEQSAVGSSQSPIIGSQFATSTSNLKHQTSNIFILFKPKDVVSGDFYWATKVNDYLIYAVADCTGHGVPGAFMSMLGISFLNEIVRKKEVTQASHVLDQLRNSVVDALKQTGESGTQKDGMDMSLVVISEQSSVNSNQNSVIGEQLADNDTELRSSEMFIEKESDTNPVATTNAHQSSQATCDSETNLKPQTSNFFNAQWAGANNPLWIVRSVTQSSGLSVEPEVCDTETKNLGNLEEQTIQRIVLQEIKPDKQPVAIYEHMKPFTNHELQLQKGDTIYLASDGYEDQFGGEKYKKFMSKRLKEMLATISEKPMSEQKKILDKTLEDWKGEHEQIDDVTIMGIKI